MVEAMVWALRSLDSQSPSSRGPGATEQRKGMWQSNGALVVYCLLIAVQQTPLICAWTWQCIDRHCVRGDNPSQESTSESLEVCHLTCGQFGALWPQPTGYTAISDKVLGFDPLAVSFDFSAVTDFSRTLVKEFMYATTHLFVENLSRSCGGNCSVVPDTLVVVYIATSSSDFTLNWLTDESYSLEITTRGSRVMVHIHADSVYGARHGLESLSQLVTHTAGDNRLVIVTTAKVSDKPAFPHRGLLLDTARNYLPLSALKRSIDAMAACKLNVLHWHATDSQSFPLMLPRVPQMARFGAYSATEVYTPTDMEMLTNYARLRGVRILLELDMPAHAGNGWQWGSTEDLGNLAVCVNQQPWRQYCLQPPCGQLNPANPSLYKVLRDVFSDIIDKLPQGEALHMGGDEVYFPCWNQSKEITDWMKSRGMGVSQSDFLDMWGEFHRKALQVWDEEVGNSKTPVLLWTSRLTDADVISRYLDKDRFVIEAWTDSNDPLALHLLDMGYRVVMATKDTWYLDHGFWGRTQYHNWRVAYDNRLPRRRGVLGGEVAMWGELVDNSNLDARVWPRAAAAAERLWADPDTNNVAAEYRLIELRERLVHRGVNPEAIAPEWCAHNEGSCLASANTS